MGVIIIMLFVLGVYLLVICWDDIRTNKRNKKDTYIDNWEDFWHWVDRKDSK